MIFKLAWVVLLLLSAFSSTADDGLNLGPLFDRSPLAVGEGSRTEALGPLFYSEQNENRRIWAIPPLVSYMWDPTLGYSETDILFPISTFRRYGKEYRWHFCQVFSVAGGQNQDEQQAKRFTLYPIYFQQRSPVPEENYTALLPIYGHVQRRLYRDEVFFVLWPLYVETRKADIMTYNYFYPFVHVRRGEGLRGWQFWPFYGQEHKEPTTRTNGFGDTEVIPGHHSQFALWPLYFNQISGLGTENPAQYTFSLPLFSRLRSPMRDSTTIIWPLFTHVTDREKQYREWQLPWPLVVFARGEGKTTSRVWPFFSQAHNANLESDFYLWPLYKYDRVHTEAADRERTRILFFLYSHTRLQNLETGKDRRRTDFWPLFTHRKDFDGSTRLQVLALLEPFLPASKSIERNYSPLWALWRSEKNAQTGATSQSLLWNLYRRDTAPEAKKCSLLFGLFQYQSNSEGKRLRLFFIPVMKTRTPVKTNPILAPTGP